MLNSVSPERHGLQIPTTINFVELRIDAEVRMEPEAGLPTAKPLRAGWGPTIAYSGKLFPGRVLACDEPIDPGRTGKATIGVLANCRGDVEMQVGSVFELRDGWTQVIATATVLSVDTTVSEG